ncbi:MAG: ABC transporter permease [Methanomassiliicoccales archaeon]
MKVAYSGEDLQSGFKFKERIVLMKKALAPRLRELRYSLYLARKSLLAMVGLILVLFVVIIAIAAPWLCPPANPADPMQIPVDFKQPKPPGILVNDPELAAHPLGTGKLGADIYYGIVWGARTSMYVSLFVVFTAAIIGIVLGAVAGYYGGAVDEALMRITDVFLSIPGLILAMAVAAVLSRSLENIMLALTVVWWPPYARLIRGQVLSVRENVYVEAARAVGSKKSRILFRHIVPNCMAPLLVQITMDIGVVVLVAAGLSFIGFGAPSGTAEWGKMVSDGHDYFTGQVVWKGQFYNPWWMWVFPGLMIFIFVMGFNLLGDGLRDIMDPRLRR